MASHAGLELVLVTKKGYIGEKGNVVKDVKDALVLPFYNVGFSSAYHIYDKLGFDTSCLEKKDIKFRTIKRSYDSRIGVLEHLYKLMGEDDYFSVYNKACDIFNRYKLMDYDNYLNFVRELEKEVLKFYEKRNIDEKIEVNNEDVKLFRTLDSDLSKDEESKLECFYSSLGEIYKYSIQLKNPHVERYFVLNDDEKNYFNNFQNEGIIDFIINYLNENAFELGLFDDFKIFNINISNGKLCIYFNKCGYNFKHQLDDMVRDFYSKREMHITRMFGSYVLLLRQYDELCAVKATPVPIKYCPLMVKLLKEIGGDTAISLLKTLETEDTLLQTKMMCNLINEVVIKGGYFDTSRPLNSCEANVLFGASETMSSAFKNGLIDAAVIVSNNLGTIITTNDSNTQGAVKRMTGLFYTTTSKEIIDTAEKANIIPVFPITGKIDQLEGVKKAISLGYKKIAVSVAANDNFLHEALKGLEKDGIVIYKFGLCSTGIDDVTAQKMRDNADVVWSCASKQVKDYVEPYAIAQVGVKIPVHIMTKRGWEIVRNHLLVMSKEFNNYELNLVNGEDEPVILNSKHGFKVLSKKYVRNCSDCPHPCV